MIFSFISEKLNILRYYKIINRFRVFNNSNNLRSIWKAALINPHRVLKSVFSGPWLELRHCTFLKHSVNSVVLSASSRPTLGKNTTKLQIHGTETHGSWWNLRLLELTLCNSLRLWSPSSELPLCLWLKARLKSWELHIVSDKLVLGQSQLTPSGSLTAQRM